MLVSFLTISVDFLLFQIDGFHSYVIRLQSQKARFYELLFTLGWR